VIFVCAFQILDINYKPLDEGPTIEVFSELDEHETRYFVAGLQRECGEFGDVAIAAHGRALETPGGHGRAAKLGCG